MGRIAARSPTQAINKRGIAMLNPALIKHGVDDEEYENACPTIPALMLAHLSRPDKAQHNPIVYGADGLFFSTYETRRMYLRPAFPNEFDIHTTEFDHQERPTLWVLVSLLCPGHHLLLPVWRGRAFWRAMETDQAVADVLHEMCLRGGLSISEWYSFICDQRVRKNDDMHAVERTDALK